MCNLDGGWGVVDGALTLDILLRVKHRPRYAGYPADKFAIAFSGETSVLRFVGEVRKVMEVLLREHGISGYNTKWIEHEFPLDLLAELRETVQLPRITDSSFAKWERQ